MTGPGHEHPEGGGRFDALAEGWDADADKVRRAHEVARAIASAVPLHPRPRLLEYGAGTGLVTQALGERVGPAVLADSSAGMRRVMEQKVAAGGLRQARVWDLDLEIQDPPQERFDLLVTSLVLHHVHDLDRVLRGFLRLLDPGGHLCVADLDREDGSFHRGDFDGHHGFERAELTARLIAAGFADVEVRDCTTLEKDGATYGVFLAVGRRPG